MKKKQKMMWTVIAMVVVVVTVGLVFWQVMENRRANLGDGTSGKTDEVNVILHKDFQADYPGSPREVVKMYSRISSCLYSNPGMSDKDFDAIVLKMRELFDDELLNSNPFDTQLKALKAEVEEYEDAKKSISSYTVDNNSLVKKSKVKGKNYASLSASYLVSSKKSGYSKTYEKFLLREDLDGRWKILGWELVKDKDKDE